MKGSFFFTTAKQAAPATPPALFDFNFEEDGKFNFVTGNQVSSYTDGIYTFNVAGDFGNPATLEADGLQLGGVFGGTGLPNDNGKKLVYNGNIPFNYAFLVVAEGRLGASATFNNAIFVTTNASNVGGSWTQGIVMATSNILTLRSQYKVSSVNQNHRLNVGNLVQQSTIIERSFSPARAFKIIRVKLNTNNIGEVVSLGALYTGNSGYSHSRLKRCILQQCNDAQADIIWANLRAYYSL